MYYAKPSRSSRSKNLQTLLLLFLLVLVIVSVALAISYSGAMRANANTRRVLVMRMQTEVSNARTRATQLLPTGGSKTESMVALVRQHVYAARAVNEMTSGIYGAGSVLVNEALINHCVEYLDDCDKKIQTGAVVTETYNQLSIAIDSLYEQVSNLE